MPPFEEYSSVKDWAPLGWVGSLEGQWVRGDSTLNTIGVAMESPQVALL